MKKLYSENKLTPRTLTLEEFVNQYETLSVISTEAAGNFLYSIKDMFSNSFNRLTDDTGEKALYEALGDRYRVLNISKKMNTSSLREAIVVTPEKFKGKYVDFLKDLVQVSEDIYPDTIKLLDNLKMAIAGFINEFKAGDKMTLYGVAYAKKSEQLRESGLKTTSKYFPLTKTVSKAYATDVLKSVKDMESIYNDLTKLGSNINKNKLQEIDKLAREVSDMVDKLVEQNQSSGVLLNNESVKKDLVNMLYIAAKNVEFCGYLYSNVLYMYAAVKSLSDTIVETDKRI